MVRPRELGDHLIPDVTVEKDSSEKDKVYVQSSWCLFILCCEDQNRYRLYSIFNFLKAIFFGVMALRSSVCW